MATLRKLRSGKWQVVIRLKNLKPQYKTFHTKRDASRWATLIEYEVQLPLAKIKSPPRPLDLNELSEYATNGSLSCLIAPLFEDWIDIFLETSCHKDKSMKGRLCYWKSRFRGFIVTQITPDMVEQELLILSESISGSSVNRYKSNLSSVFKQLNKTPEFRPLKCLNPVRSEFISSFPENPHRDRFLSPEEQKRILYYAKDSHWPMMHLFVLIALSTGARKSEILNLKLQDIDLIKNTAFITKSKNGKPRYVPLISEVQKYLTNLYGNPSHACFPSTISPIQGFDVTKAWLRLRAASNLPSLRIHDLRHTTASNMIAQGHTLIEVAELLGHSQISTTKRYAHLAYHNKAIMVETVWQKIQGAA